MAGFPRRGEVWLVEFPDDPKVRPALIVSLDVRNELANSVLAVPITTNLRPSPSRPAARQTGRADARFDGPLRERQLSPQVASLQRPARRHDQSRTHARGRKLPAPVT